MEKKIKIIIWILIAIVVFQASLFLFLQKEEIAEFWKKKGKPGEEISVSQREEIDMKVEKFKETCLKTPQPLLEAWAIEPVTLPGEEMGEFGEWEVKRLSRDFIFCLALEHENLAECDRFFEMGPEEITRESGEVVEGAKGEEAKVSYDICQRNYFIYYKVVLPIIENRSPDISICEEEQVSKYMGGSKEYCEIALEVLSKKDAQFCSKIENNPSFQTSCEALALDDLNLCKKLEKDEKNNCEMTVYYFQSLLPNGEKAAEKFQERSKILNRSQEEVEFVKQVRGLFYEGKTCQDLYGKALKEKYCDMKTKIYEQILWGK